MGQTTGTAESEGKTLAGDPVEDPRYTAALRATAAAQGASLDEVPDNIQRVAARDAAIIYLVDRSLGYDRFHANDLAVQAAIRFSLDAARNHCVALAAKRMLILPDVLKCSDAMTTSSGAAPCGSRCKPVQ